MTGVMSAAETSAGPWPRADSEAKSSDICMVQRVQTPQQGSYRYVPEQVFIKSSLTGCKDINEGVLGVVHTLR